MVLEIGHDPMVSTATLFLGDPRMVVCLDSQKNTAEVLEQKRQEEDDWKRQLKELLGMSFSISWEISLPCGFQKNLDL